MKVNSDYNYVAPTYNKNFTSLPQNVEQPPKNNKKLTFGLIGLTCLAAAGVYIATRGKSKNPFEIVVSAIKRENYVEFTEKVNGKKIGEYMADNFREVNLNKSGKHRLGLIRLKDKVSAEFLKKLNLSEDSILYTILEDKEMIHNGVFNCKGGLSKELTELFDKSKGAINII